MNDERYEQLARHFSGETTAALEEELRQWRAAEPANEAEFQAAARAWQSLDHAEDRDNFDVQAGWRNLANRLELEKPAEVVPIRAINTNRYRFLMAAAAFLIAAFLATIFLMNREQTTWQAEPDATLVVELVDGSNMVVAQGGQAIWRKDANERIIELKGGARFDVVSDGRPFRVLTENAEVRVLGTSFEVIAKDNQTHVFVTEGRVSLQSKTGIVFLEANQGAGVSAQDDLIRLRDTSGQPYFHNWHNDRLVFRDHKLSEVTAVLNARFKADIRLAKPELGDLRLTATFEEASLDAILRDIALALGLTMERNGEIYLLKSS